MVMAAEAAAHRSAAWLTVWARIALMANLASWACTFSPEAVSGADLDATSDAGGPGEADAGGPDVVAGSPDGPGIASCDGDGTCDPEETVTGCPADCCLASCTGGCSGCCRTSLADAVCFGTGSCLCYHECVGFGDTCTTQCSGASSCAVDCRGSNECYPECSGGSSCSIDCRGVQSECHVTCSSSDCVLNCAGASSCEFTQCSGGGRTVANCGGGLYVCNLGGVCP